MVAKAVPLIGFACFSLALGLVLVQAFGTSETAVAIYALTVGLAALLLPMWKALDKDYVDLAYYGAAIYVAWQLFIFYGPRREATLIFIEHANMEGQIAAVERTQVQRLAMLSDLGTFLAAVREGSEHSYSTLEAQALFQCGRVTELEMQASIAEQAQRQAEATSLRVEKEQAQMQCNFDRSSLSQNEWEVVKEVKDAGALIALQSWIRGQSISVDFRSNRIALSDAVAALFGETPTVGVSEAAALETQRRTLDGKLVDLRNKVNQLVGKETESDLESKKKAAAASGHFIEISWPFTLICLLGMKLARTNHLAPVTTLFRRVAG